MIKPEELRIGDYVRVSSDNCLIPQGALCEVVAIDSERTCEDKKGLADLLQVVREEWEFSHGVWCNYIEGILLTPEILEKNGWNKRHDPTSSCDIYSKGKGAFYVRLEQSIYKKQEGFDCVVADSTYRFGNKLQYVHQLQHILWALGEGTNLKI